MDRSISEYIVDIVVALPPNQHRHATVKRLCVSQAVCRGAYCGRYGAG